MLAEAPICQSIPSVMSLSITRSVARAACIYEPKEITFEKEKNQTTRIESVRDRK